MHLKDLERIKEYSELDLLFEIKKIIEESEQIAERTIKGSKKSINLLQNNIDDIIMLSKEIRSICFKRKGKLFEPVGNFDRLIKSEKEKEDKRENKMNRRVKEFNIEIKKREQ